MTDARKLLVLAMLAGFTGAACTAAAVVDVPASAAGDTAAAADASRAATPAAVCGNGLIESGETCEDCPDDCIVDRPCETTSKSRIATVDLVQAERTYPLGFAIRIAYRNDKLSIPGSAFDSSVVARVATSKESSHVVARDVGHSLRLVITDPQGLNDSSLTITFDTCKGARAAADDAICWVEGCTGRGTDIRGCGCNVRNIR